MEYSDSAGEGGSDFRGEETLGDCVCSSSSSTGPSSSDSSTCSVLVIFFRFGVFFADFVRFLSFVIDLDLHLADLHFLELHTCAD